MAKTEIELLVNGQLYTGWEDINVSRSIEAIAAKFELTVSRLLPFPIESGDLCTLILNKEIMCTGYVDTVTAAVDGENHSIRVRGRDKTADLVDSSATNFTQEFNNIGFTDLLETLCKPFGIDVDVQVAGLAPFKKFALQQETVGCAIERACRVRGVFANTDALGNLIVQNYGAVRADTGFTLGENIKSAEAEYDFTDRFSEYIVYGQQPGDDDTDEDAASQVYGRATDPRVKRYRPLIIMAEGPVAISSAQARAEWEAVVRAARSFNVAITIPDWDQTEGGRLWQINELAAVRAPLLGVNNDLLIKAVQFRIDNMGGIITDLNLTRADAYKKQPDLDEEKETGLKKGESDSGGELVWKD